MRIQEHVKLSTVATLVALPWLKKRAWIPFTASILIDVDHFIWYAIAHRDLSLRNAVRYFRNPQAKRSRLIKFLHQPFFLLGLAGLARGLRSNTLWLIFSGMLFHSFLDTIHNTEMASIQRVLSAEAKQHCPACGKPCDALQLHTVRPTRNLIKLYQRDTYSVLCPACHRLAHLPLRLVPTTPIDTKMDPSLPLDEEQTV